VRSKIYIVFYYDIVYRAKEGRHIRIEDNKYGWIIFQLYSWKLYTHNINGRMFLFPHGKLVVINRREKFTKQGAITGL